LCKKTFVAVSVSKNQKKEENRVGGEIRRKEKYKKIRFPAWCAAVPAGQPPPETLLTAVKPVGFWKEHRRVLHESEEREQRV